MSYELMANILYVILALCWTVYITQELFISGSSALNIMLSRNDEERILIQETAGLHFNGVEVWLISAFALTEGTYPAVYSKIFTHLYVIMFLLLYAFIIRGVTIPFIYKLDILKWRKSIIRAWTLSSFMIIFLVGVYISNLFFGYPLGVNGMEEGFTSALNVTSITTGLLFVLLGLIVGAAWIMLTTKEDLGKRAFAFVKKAGLIYIVPVLLVIVYIGHYQFGSTINIIEMESKSSLIFVLPLLSIVTAILTTFYAYKFDANKVFAFSTVTVILFMLSGFISNYPFLVPSTVNLSYGLTISQTVVSKRALTIVLVGALVFLPIVIGYQTWKYYRFSAKSKPINK